MAVDDEEVTIRATIDASGTQSGAAQAVAAFNELKVAQDAAATSAAAATVATEALAASLGSKLSLAITQAGKSYVGFATYQSQVEAGIRSMSRALDEQAASTVAADTALRTSTASIGGLIAARAGMAEFRSGAGPLAEQLSVMEAQRTVEQGYARDVQNVAAMYAMEARAANEAREAEAARLEISKEAKQIYASATADMMAAEARSAAARRAASELMIPPIPAGATVWRTTGDEAERAFARGAAGVRAMRAEVEATTAAGITGAQGWRTYITLFDEFMRGQRGAEAATLGRVLKGGGGAGLLATVGGIAVVGGIEKLTSNMAELAEKTDTAAAAAGMSVDQFSALQRTMQLVDGDANKATRSLAMLGRQVEAALSDPMGKAANEFSKFGVTQQQLADGLKDPLALLDLLRQRFQEMPADMQRAAIVSMSAGRGFQELIPYLKLTNDRLAELKSKIPVSSIITQETVDRLTPAAESAHALSEAISGLGLAIAESTASTKFNDWLRGIITSLTDGISAIDNFISATGRLSEGQQQTKNQIIGGVAGAVAGSLAGPVGTVVGAGVGAYAGGKLPTRPGPTQSEPMNPAEGAYAALPYPRFSVAPGVDLSASADLKALAQAMREAAEELPPGYNVQATSGLRPGARVAGTGGVSEHALGEAIDTKITGPGGVAFPSMGPDPTGIYKEYGELIQKRLQAIAPQLAERFASGTQFAKQDAGHYDLGGARGARGPAVAAPAATTAPAGLPAGYDFQTTVLNAPQPGAAALEKEFQANLKFVEDKQKLLDATSAQEVAKADKDEGAIVAIKQRELKATQGVLAQEQALRATYAARILQTEDVNAKAVAAKVQDSTGMQVKMMQAGTSQVEAQNTLARQQVQDQINLLEAEKLKAKTFQEQYDIELKIAALKAQLNRDAAGELDKARALNALEKERTAEAIKNADFQARASDMAYKGMSGTLKLQSIGAGGDRAGRGYQNAAAELSFLQSAGAQEIASYQRIADASTTSEATQREMYVKIGEAAERTANQEIVLAEKVATEMKKSADESSKVFVQSFSSIGSTFESTLTKILSGQGRTAGKEAVKSLMNDLVHTVSGFASEQSANFLGKLIGIPTAPGTGLSTVLGQGLGKLLGFGASAAGTGVQNSATDLATQNMKVLSDQAAKLGVSFVTSQSANVANTSATLLNTSATAANTTAEATAGAGAAAGGAASAGGGLLGTLGSIPLLGGLIKGGASLLGIGGGAAAAGGSILYGGAEAGGVASGAIGVVALRGGGIIPSAAGGYMVPEDALGGGGQLSILHPHEMVLPAPISQGFQEMLGGGGGSRSNTNSANLNYSPTINNHGSSIGSRAQFESFMRSHGNELVNVASNLIRNGWRPGTHPYP